MCCRAAKSRIRSVAARTSREVTKNFSFATKDQYTSRFSASMLKSEGKKRATPALRATTTMWYRIGAARRTQAILRRPPEILCAPRSVRGASRCYRRVASYLVSSRGCAGRRTRRGGAPSGNPMTRPAERRMRCGGVGASRPVQRRTTRAVKRRRPPASAPGVFPSDSGDSLGQGRHELQLAVAKRLEFVRTFVDTSALPSLASRIERMSATTACR